MNAKKVERFWGHEVHWANTDKYSSKIIHINRGNQTKLRKHDVKDKTIYVLQGLLILELGLDKQKNNKAEIMKVLETGESFRVKPGTIYRFVAPRECFARLIETSTAEIDDGEINI